MNQNFVEIPLFPKYLINEEGVVINKQTGTIINSYTSKNYGARKNSNIVNVYRDTKGKPVKHTVTIQRLLCLAFHGVAPVGTYALVKDYDKPVTKDNVHWQPRSVIRETKKRNLKTNNSTPILVSNTVTGEVQRFGSVKELVLKLGISRERFNRNISGRTKTKTIYKFEYEEKS